ncbi:MAG: DUF4166 domain-containing protein [Gammaproteobacteria bacterium]|nr:DUF4166 domain-containing protein [Gammaproteobacteria bacterium]MDH5651972.1 DUF4166 domain-containing protein [Gammaproteobacteria bacterium]
MQIYATESVIKTALGKEWDNLAAPIQRHYGLSPGTQQQIILTGTMTSIRYSLIGKLFVLLSRPFGALVHLKGNNIPVTVRNYTTDDPDNFFWHRTFSPQQTQQKIFCSRMVHAGGNEIIEFVRLGMGIRMQVTVNDMCLHYRGIRYEWHIGKFTIPIPNWLALGKGEIIEEAVDDNTVRVDFRIIHPMFGETFSYRGQFKLQ